MRFNNVNYLHMFFAVGSLLSFASVPRALAEDSRSNSSEASVLSISLSRFKEFKNPAAWLKRQLQKKGFKPGQFAIDAKRVVTTDLQVMRYLNRIVAFLWHRATTAPPFIHRTRLP